MNASVTGFGCVSCFKCFRADPTGKQGRSVALGSRSWVKQLKHEHLHFATDAIGRSEMESDGGAAHTGLIDPFTSRPPVLKRGLHIDHASIVARYYPAKIGR